MFSLFPVHRPRLGISVRSHALDLVEVRRGWGRAPMVTRLLSRPLPAGLVVPSATQPNVSDPAALATELAALLKGVRDRAVAIDLPMACGTLALHHFDTVPSVRTEQEALLRWRLRQEEHLTAPDLTLLWQVFGSAASGRAAVSVLSVAIKQSILAQYHRACEDAALIPVSMGLSTFHIMELARAVLSGPHEELYVAHRTVEALTVLAFRQGRPACLRVKPFRRGTVDLSRELLHTLRYFAQEHPALTGAEPRTTPCYVVDEVASETEPQSEDSSESWTTVQENWTVSVHRAGWATGSMTGIVPRPEQPPFGALAAVLAA